MPLIVITGIPSSGKTKRTEELVKHFKELGKEVNVVSENDYTIKYGFEKNACYSDSSKEKHIRSFLKSEACRLLQANNVVILDGLNYIKGYRYELYCASKAQNTTQCTIHTEINREDAWKFNENRKNDQEKYTRNIFDELVMRYENPEAKNRWDSPLFVLFPNTELDKEAITNCLFHKAPPPPNMSTQNAPLNSTNYLYDLDQITKKIVDDLIQAINRGSHGITKIPGHDLTIDLTNANVKQLMILRKQYITYSKMHAPNTSQIPQLFVHYLNANLQ